LSSLNRSLVVALALLCAGACDRADESAPAGKSEVARIADEYLDAYFAQFPIDETLSGRSAAPHDRLGDQSVASILSWQAREDSLLAKLERVDTTQLEPGSADAVTYGFVREWIRNNKAWRACRMELWNVSPTWTGWQQNLATLAGSQPIGAAAQNDAAYRRFAELPKYLEREVANLREGLQRGYSAPGGNVQGVIDQANGLLATEAPSSPFVQIAPDSLKDFHDRMLKLETEQIRPAIQKYRDFLRDEYMAKARKTIAVADNPNGADCYRAAIRYHSTVDITPEEVHRIGLEQMEKIQTEMKQISQRMFGHQDVARALNTLKTDPKYLMGSRANAQKAAEDAQQRAQAALPRFFGVIPKQQLKVVAVQPYAEANAPGGFYAPGPDDGSRPGTYYINLRGAEKLPRAGLESTAFHEGYPGHHLQTAIALERTGLHPVQKYFYMSGFGEGWALYTERLADEMGLFSSDVDRMGLLSNEALRAARLVVDPGMHALGWSRDRAIQYMLANTAESRASVVAEVDRYIAVPGQATSYMLGNLEIRRLRELAREKLGDKFDIRAFHDRVLEDGAVPLVMLRQKIERWIASL
jgi:uncharacterized protein (DUF885 family)